MPRRLPPLALLLVAVSASAQPLADVERAEGYALRADTVVFAFDPALYGLAAPPERVVVTGAFRGWDADMDDAAWSLAPTEGGVWTLAVAASEIAPGTPFKYRVDGGRWLDPPAGAPNAEGGNLVYQVGATPPRLVAELRGERSVWVRVEGAPRPLAPAAYRVVRWDGEAVDVAQVIPNEAGTALLVPFAALDPAQVHTVEADAGGAALRSVARFDGLWRDLASPKPLGAAVRSGETTFRLFAPRADSVALFLYPNRTGGAGRSVGMARDEQGVWEHAEPADLEGTWYDYAVIGPDGPGSHFTNQTGRHVTDPYALVSDDSWGRARVWRDRPVVSPLRGGRPAMEDVVAYEVHLQDFTDELPVPDGVGPLEAFATPGLVNGRGEPVGIDYLDRLGVNVVHLLPVQEYLHYPDSTWAAAFADDAFMQSQGVATENYQWGYRTTHAFAVESRFRSAGDEPGAERQRFRDLVSALHERGMAVVVDVVFNHTGEDMDGAQQEFTFNGIDKWYYYRLNDDGEHIGAFGNEVKSENRPMTQRWLLDQLRHFVDVFGVDGFRIDLAGQTDQQTLAWIQDQLGCDVLIYGEPWIGSNDPDYEANPDWDWYKEDSPITFFQDEARNAFKGSPLDPPTPAPVSRGFAGGDPAARDAALQGVANAYAEEPTPNGGINYLDIHDNWALADRFASTQTGDGRWDGRGGVRAAEVRIAAALLLTGLGPVVIHGGTEIARSKGLAPLPETLGGELALDDMPLATIYVKGRGDTYNLRAPNRFAWETVGQSSGPVDYAVMHDWWRGLIALRLSDVGEVFRVGEAVPEGYVRPVLLDDAPTVLGYVVGDRVLVVMNTGETTERLDLPALGGAWRLVARSDDAGGAVDLGGLAPAGGVGAQAFGPRSVRVWVRASE